MLHNYNKVCTNCISLIKLLAPHAHTYNYTATYGRQVGRGHFVCFPSSGYWTRRRHWSFGQTQMQQDELVGGASNQEDAGQIELVSAKGTLQPLVFSDLKVKTTMISTKNMHN